MFKRSRLGIKVCRKNYLGEFVSCFEDGKKVEYKIGKWTKRPKDCGSLAVFDTIEHATEFVGNKWGIRYYFKCKYKPSKDVMWRPNRIKTLIIYKKHDIPIGTKYANKVKLVDFR